MEEEDSTSLNPTGFEQSNVVRLLQNETLGDRCIFNLTKDDIMGMEFNNELDDKNFYHKYALVIGFFLSS